MSHLALDKVTSDLIKPEGGGVARVTKGRFVVQQVQSKLRTYLGEWFLDRDIGWVEIADYEKNPKIAALESRARVIILGTAGVLSINSMRSTLEGREMYMQFTASTIYGTIDLTVPWGVR